MNPIEAILARARKLATVAPDPRHRMTAEDLARALHAVENDGRMARFGSAMCHHEEKAEDVFQYLKAKEDGRW